jgi:predicted DNA-binding protein YlxM (UPF0122 family)
MYVEIKIDIPCFLERRANKLASFFPSILSLQQKNTSFFFFTDDLWMQTANQQKKLHQQQINQAQKKYYSNKMNTISTTEMYVEYNDTFKVNKP